MAPLFGFAPSGYQTFGAWERGDFAPPIHHRFAMVLYLLQQLDFAHDLELFEQVWQALTSHWKWEQGLLPAEKVWLEQFLLQPVQPSSFASVVVVNAAEASRPEIADLSQTFDNSSQMPIPQPRLEHVLHND